MIRIQMSNSYLINAPKLLLLNGNKCSNYSKTLVNEITALMSLKLQYMQDNDSELNICLNPKKTKVSLYIHL